jgi:hypothetical protein
MNNKGTATVPEFDSATATTGVSLASVVERQVAIERKLDTLIDLLADRRPAKDYYTTSEVAEILVRAEFTVREWCRLGRIYAEKRLSGRGRAKEWIVSHQELTRIRNEGLLPLD